MVEGLERFTSHFADYVDQYALIGGAACDLTMRAAPQPFRATKDLDIVLLLESLNSNFVGAFWEFVRAGAYEARTVAAEQRQSYRFQRPGSIGFPAMLELFSRVPDAIAFQGEGHLTPIPVDEAVSSLSAILLDADYYGWVRDGKIVEDNLSFVRAEHLIPLKARAWLDLSDRKDHGDSVSSSDIKKHKNDVFRLMLVVDPEYTLTIPAGIASDMERFANRVIGEPIDLPSLGIRKMKPNEAIEQLRSIYVK